MRIIAGNLRGRIFDSPHGHRTHPMSDKIRGAIFNALGDIEGLTVLDAFAGSGAIGFEALSRGASRITFIDADKEAQNAIARNITTLDVADKAQLLRMYVHSYLTRNKEPFDVVIADPPYDDLQYKTLDKLPRLVKPGGILVYSLPPSARLVLPADMELLQQKSYGDATLSFYRKII